MKYNLIIKYAGQEVKFTNLEVDFVDAVANKRLTYARLVA